MTTLRNGRKLATINNRTMRNIPGLGRRGRRMFLEYKKTISLRCQKRLRVEWHRNCSRSLAERRFAFGRSLQTWWVSSGPEVPVHSGSVPETSWYPSRENQKPTENRYQKGPHPEAKVSLSQSSPDCCPDDACDSLTNFFSHTVLICPTFQSIANFGDISGTCLETNFCVNTFDIKFVWYQNLG